MIDDLNSMRRETRAARRALPPANRAAADAAINRHLGDLLIAQSPQRVSSYLTTDGEPDLAELHAACRRTGIEVVVPVMGAEGTLEFRALGSGPFAVNASGIPEPQGTERVDFRSIDVVLVPLVVFDQHGNRAGRGGGWYDRALAARHADQGLVGVAYTFQQRPEVPIHPGDVPLDMVVTETRIHRFPSRRPE